MNNLKQNKTKQKTTLILTLILLIIPINYYKCNRKENATRLMINYRKVLNE